MNYRSASLRNIKPLAPPRLTDPRLLHELAGHSAAWGSLITPESAPREAQPRASSRGHSRVNRQEPRVGEKGAKYLQMLPELREKMTTSLTVKGQKMYPFRTRSPRFSVANAEETPAKAAKADARTRTGDPFITREGRVRDARPFAGTSGHVLAGKEAV